MKRYVIAGFLLAAILIGLALYRHHQASEGANYSPQVARVADSNSDEADVEKMIHEYALRQGNARQMFEAAKKKARRMDSLEFVEDQILQALAKGEEEAIHALEERRGWLPNIVSKMMLDGIKSADEKKIAQAHRIALLAAEQLGSGKALERYNRIRSWSPEELKQWVKANELVEEVYEGYLSNSSAATMLNSLREAKAIFERLGASWEMPWINFRLGILHSGSGNLKTAFVCFKEALKRSQIEGDLLALNKSVYNIGRHFLSHANLSVALKYFEQNYSLSRQLRDASGLIKALIALALIYDKQGQASAALEKANEAFQVWEEWPDEELGPFIFQSFGTVYETLGEIDKASEYFAMEAALTDAHEVRGHALKQLAYLAYLNDNFELARKYATAAEKVIKKGIKAQGIRNSELKVWLAYTLTTKGLSEMRLGLYEQAYSSLARAMTTGQDAGPLNKHYYYRELGLFYLTCGDYRNALSCFDRAKAKLAEVGSPDEPLMKLETALGRAYEGMGLTTRAESYYRSAIARVEKMRGFAGGLNLRARLLSNKNIQEPYVALVRVYIRQRRYIEALLINEMARSRALRDALSQSFQQMAIQNRDPIYAQTLAAEKEIEELQAKLFQRSKGNEEIWRKLRNARDRYEQLLMRLEARYPVSTGVSKTIARADLDRVIKALPKDSAVIEYRVTDDGTYIWVLTNGHVACRSTAVRSNELRRLITRIRKPLENLKIRGLGLGNLEIDANALYELHRVILSPVSDLIRTKRELIIIPDDYLYYVPFEMLVTGFKTRSQPTDGTLFTEYEALEYLVEKYAVSYAPSISLIPLGHKRFTVSGGESLLALGGPAYRINDDNRVRLRATPGWTFESLPSAADEVRSISRFFPKALVLTGVEARESRLKSEVGNYDIIHLATHAVSEDEAPLYSRIILAQGIDENEDGFLQAYEILKMRLKAKLVVLSGCETGLGKLRRGEGMEGLASAFLRAGAKSMLVTLWSVEDTTSVFMKGFYESLRAKKLPVCKALREAKLALMRTRGRTATGAKVSFSHPYFWAPFVLIRTSR